MLKLPTFMKPKRQLNLLIAGMFLALQMPLFLAVPAVNAAPKDDEPKKVYVCKYVGTPGTDERLQTGQNPIEVSVNSIQNNEWNGQVPGYFSDAHDRSYVLGYVGEMSPEPTAANCPAPERDVIEIPAAPSINDPCGIENASWNIPEDTATLRWDLAEEGELVVTIVAANTTFAGGAITHNYGSAADTNEDCPEEVKVTLCHATHSEGNPFEEITVAAAAAYNGHLGGGNGDHQGAEDIIPPFTFNGQEYSQNWDEEGQIIFRNHCVVPEEPETEAPTASATIIPCVFGSGFNDIVSVNVTNTDDDTNATVEYTVQLGGQIKTITLEDGESGSINFSGVSAGTVLASVTGDDETGATTNEVTVSTCEDEGDILGEVIPTGGQGAAVVTPVPSVLADTGKNLTASMFAAIAIIGATCALAITSRRARFNQ